ncbi:MAG: DUF4350 domain-containing protein [Sphingomonadales bacterium]|nr:DUF4350 domain-containing protein [Sphingomonadales bacterium]
MTAGAANPSPFSPRTVLALVLFGGAVFVALLWMIGAGMTAGNTNNGGGHVGGKGLNGYAALASYLEKRGMTVTRVRSAAGLDGPGLLVLTPPVGAEGKELQAIVDKRKQVGPTLVILPKWASVPIAQNRKGAKQGWVDLPFPQVAPIPGFFDDLTVEMKDAKGAPANGQWSAQDITGSLPDPKVVIAGRGKRLVPLVASAADGRTLAGWIADGGIYPGLEDLSLNPPETYGEDEDSYPVVFVFDPDLLDNWGMARPENARLAEALFRAAMGDDGKAVAFDLTQNGLGQSANLLTLAFTPPFLAATLCLLIAALAVGWRAFVRFGPARAGVRAIAFGKRALVSNAAGLIRRTRRLHLIAPPYADHARERIARALALPRMAEAAETEAAIDRALEARVPGTVPFSAIAARLRAARRPNEMLGAAQDLHALERMLTR